MRPKSNRLMVFDGTSQKIKQHYCFLEYNLLQQMHYINEHVKRPKTTIRRTVSFR